MHSSIFNDTTVRCTYQFCIVSRRFHERLLVEVLFIVPCASMRLRSTFCAGTFVFGVRHRQVWGHGKNVRVMFGVQENDIK